MEAAKGLVTSWKIFGCFSNCLLQNSNMVNIQAMLIIIAVM